MKEIYITHARRTAVGNFMGGLATIPAPKLGEHVLKALLSDSGLDPAAVSEVIMGQVLTGASGQNPARQTSINSGLPNTVPAFTINKVCGSGLKAVALAAQSILTGDNELVIAGGQESMSLAQHALLLRPGMRMGNASMIDMMMYDGLTDVFSNQPMGITAENVSKQFGITRQMQDELSYHSHMKAAKAQAAGKFDAEVVPVEVELKKESIIVSKDEFIKANTTIEGLFKLRPAFDKEGTVTAGNSSGINDGAAAVIVASGDAVKRYGLMPIARIVSYATAGVDPSIMGIGPIPASRRALEKAGWEIGELDLIEVNEAFAAQSAYVHQQMGWALDKVNVNGGAIALGHPIGASGARVLVTLIHEMQKRGLKERSCNIMHRWGYGHCYVYRRYIK